MPNKSTRSSKASSVRDHSTEDVALRYKASAHTSSTPGTGTADRVSLREDARWNSLSETVCRRTDLADSNMERQWTDTMLSIVKQM